VSYFPSYLQLDDKRVLLVGGGAIALEKLEKLVDFTDNIEVITKDSTDEFDSFASTHSIPVEYRVYSSGDIDGYDIVIVATDTQEIHREIYEESRSSRILVNSVDNTKYCDFIFPSYIKRGDLTISVSTSGSSPAMAKRLRRYIEELIPSNIASFLSEMRELRTTIPKGKERMRYFEEKSDRFMQKNFYKK